MRILITVLFSASLLVFCGCATAPSAGSSSSALSFYSFDDSHGVGLIRAFQDENTTVLQFANLEGETFVIFDGEGRQLKYERVGEHYVILPGTYSSLTVQMVTRNAFVSINGASGKTVKKRQMVASKAPAVPPEPKSSIPAVQQGQAVEPVLEKVTLRTAVPRPVPKVAPASSGETAPPERNQVTSTGLTGYVVQAGTCTDRPSAEKLKEKLASYGYNAEIKVRSNPKRGNVYGVRLHPAGLVDAYDSMKRLRHDLGVHPKLMEIPADELAAYEAGK
jgi:hypothetical protein